MTYMRIIKIYCYLWRFNTIYYYLLRLLRFITVTKRRLLQKVPLNGIFFRFSVSPIHSLSQSSESMKKSMEKLKQYDLELSKEVTPVLTPTTPGTSSSNASSGQNHKNTGGVTIDSIQAIPPFKPRKSKEWTLPAEVIFLKLILSLSPNSSASIVNFEIVSK